MYHKIVTVVCVIIVLKPFPKQKLLAYSNWTCSLHCQVSLCLLRSLVLPHTFYAVLVIVQYRDFQWLLLLTRPCTFSQPQHTPSLWNIPEFYLLRVSFVWLKHSLPHLCTFEVHYHYWQCLLFEKRTALVVFVDKVKFTTLALCSLTLILGYI